MRPRLILSLLFCAALPMLDAQSVRAQAHIDAQSDAPATSAATIETLRIRGLVDSVNVGSILLQLSRGVSVQVDLYADTPMFIASRMEPKDLAPGARLRVSTRTGAQGANVALEVMTMSNAQAGAAEADALPELTFQGALKAQEEEGGEQTLVLADKGSDRRVNISPDTTYWRLRPAGLRDLKPGMALSVVILKDANGDSLPQRAVFGAPIAGVLLPL
jgi:hypothetical protein